MEKERTLKEITPRSQDFSQWYLDVVLKAELADYGPVKGCMIVRPYGYAVWEAMQADMDRRIKETGHVNAYFPLFIPKSFLEKEKEHVEGFSPECAWVTIGGGEELDEPLAIRPTSEAMICSMYAKWVRSWRDLPVLINQWANVVRWEKVTRPFLRTTEFLWQEGHTLHATAEEAEEETLRMLHVYRSFCEETLAMPVLWGRKSESEKFAGALRTYAIEALMGDGKALQAGTSHNLGQHFATAYGIEFLDKDQQRALPWSTSWGTSTRNIGGLVMTHGDDSGLILPPKVAPYQAVIVPIPPRKGDWNEAVLPSARQVQAALRGAGIRVRLDDRDQHQPGFKYADWEMRGVPLRLEIGPKDVEKGQAVLVRRDTREKAFVPLEGLATAVKDRLDALQADLLARARKFLADNTARVKGYDELKQVMAERRGLILAGWCGDAACEAAIEQETKATIRIIPIEGDASPGACVRCGGASPREVYFAQASDPVLTLLAATLTLACGPPAASRDTDPARAREAMVASQIEERGVRDARTLAAMRKVPRHLFVPPALAGQAYGDHPLPIGHDQTISQPYIVAFMTEVLGLRGGETVLEVGTGSGYQAAVLAEIAARVYTIEIVAPLAEEARARLARRGYRNVEVRAGDGYQGWPEKAPFDAVMVTAAAPRIPQPLKDQLKEGGRLVIPVGDDYQELVVVTRRGTEYVEKRVLPVRFVPMTGKVRQ